MELSGKWPVKALCDEMSVNRSGFYKYRARRIAPSERAVKKANDIALFLTFHRKHPSHGYRWLNAKIRLGLGLVMSDEYARRCCRCAGIVSESRHYRYKKPGEPGKSFPNMILASLDITSSRSSLNDSSSIPNAKSWNDVLFSLDIKKSFRGSGRRPVEGVYRQTNRSWPPHRSFDLFGGTIIRPKLFTYKVQQHFRVLLEIS
jgi:hypothetical protein